MAVRTDGNTSKGTLITKSITIDHSVKIREHKGGKCEIRVYFALNMQEILYYAELVSALMQSPANYLVVEYIPSSTVAVQTQSVSLAAAECQVLSLTGTTLCRFLPRKITWS